MTREHKDIWSQWLLKRRTGGDPDLMQKTLEYLSPVRDKVLQHANLSEGDALLDIGCGDGLIAFGALEKTTTGKVFFSDISQELLDHARSIAEEAGVIQRCEFLLASADDLSTLDDACVEAVTTRSVLIYVSRKREAFDEFYRVLKAGGRLSIFEPINRFDFPGQEHTLWGCDVTLVMDLANKVKAVYERRQPSETDPMLDFDERDLLAMAVGAGFKEIHLELQVEIGPRTHDWDWDAFVQVSPNPKSPTAEEAIDEALTPAEAERFVAYMRPMVEGKQGTRRSAVAYLWAVKGIGQ